MNRSKHLDVSNFANPSYWTVEEETEVEVKGEKKRNEGGGEGRRSWLFAEIRRRQRYIRYNINNYR